MSLEIITPVGHGLKTDTWVLDARYFKWLENFKKFKILFVLFMFIHKIIFMVLSIGASAAKQQVCPSKKLRVACALVQAVTVLIV